MIGVVASSAVAAGGGGGGGGSHSDLLLAEGPVWYYKLDEASYGASGVAADASGNNRHGAYSTSLVTFGKPPLVAGTGTSVGFASGTQNVAAPATPKTAQWTYIVYHKTTATNDNNPMGGASDGILNIGAMAPGLARAYNYATGVGAHWATAVNDGVRHQLAAVQDATTLRLYVDGVERASVASAPVAPSGNGAGYVNQGGAGDYDEAAYFDKALSPAKIMDLWKASGPAYVASSLTQFTGNTGTKTAALPAGAVAGHLLTFHVGGNLAGTCVMGGTGWTTFNNGYMTVAYKFLDAADITAGQVTWTMSATNFEVANASLSVFSGVGSVAQTSNTTGTCNTDIVSPASGAVAAGGLLVALGANIQTASISHGAPASPWADRVRVNTAYQSVFMATRPADTANVTCTWPLATWTNYTAYQWKATILRLLP